MRALTALAFALFLVAGCYESDVPLTEGDSALDPSLLGTWRQIDVPGSDVPLAFALTPEGAAAYEAEVCCAFYPNAQVDTLHLRLATARVDTALFVTLQPAEADAPYYLFRYRQSPDGVLTLWAVGRPLFDALDPSIASPEALRAFLTDHLDDPRLYLDEPLQFKKQPAERL